MLMGMSLCFFLLVLKQVNAAVAEQYVFGLPGKPSCLYPHSNQKTHFSQATIRFLS